MELVFAVVLQCHIKKAQHLHAAHTHTQQNKSFAFIPYLYIIYITDSTRVCVFVCATYLFVMDENITIQFNALYYVLVCWEL